MDDVERHPPFRDILGRMNDKLAARAAAQGGAFTRAQALAAGYLPAQIDTFLRLKQWSAPYHGSYVVTEQLEALSSDPAARHLMQAAARVLTSKLGLVASHRTGALVHQLPLLGSPPVRPQLTRAPRFAGDTSATKGLYVASLPEDARAVRAGIPVTALARTVCDVARRSPFRAGVVPADAALRAGLSHELLIATALLYAGWPGGRRAVKVARFADGRAETPIESITRVGYDEQDLPAPETQIEICSPNGRVVGIVDFLWRAQRTVGEADGMLKYDAQGALRREKLREEDLRACGLEVVRNTWDDAWTLAGRRELARRVRQAFGFAAERPPVPGVGYRVPSLEELTRSRRPLPDHLAS